MGIPERKEREREGRRRLILETTKTLILERGVEAVTMNEIAQGAELSKAALYLFFASKEAILEEIIFEAGQYFSDFVEARMPANASGIEAIRTIWLSYIEIFGESSEIFIMIGIKNHIAPSFPLVMEYRSGERTGECFAMYTLVAKIIARGVADGTLDASVSPESAARMILMISGGIIESVARLPKGARNVKLILAEMKSVFEIILRGLASETCDRSLLTLPTKIE